jgi:hypothetical protein
MAGNKPGGGWGVECEASLEYDDDNYYLLIWDDPCFMEIRNTQQVIAALALSLVEGEGKWEMHVRMGDGEPSDSIKELMDHLNAEQNGSPRMPSDNYVSDENGYVHIRRIHAKYEE